MLKIYVPANFVHIVIFISKSCLTIFYNNYFHIDRDLRRKQNIRYRQRVHEKSFYCVQKKDLSNSRKLVCSFLKFYKNLSTSFIDNINNSIDLVCDRNDNEEEQNNINVASEDLYENGKEILIFT